MIENKILKEKIIQVRELESATRSHIEAMYEKPSHLVRKTAILTIMRKYLPGRDFVDIGCAEGIYCGEALIYHAKSVTGIDVSATKIHRARDLFPNATFFVLDIDRISKQIHTKFDFALCAEVFQHLLDYRKALGKVLAIIRKGGFLLLSVPNLAAGEKHVRATITSNMTVDELLKEVGGAGYGRQNAIWKFNTSLFEKEILSTNRVELMEKVPINTPDGKISNLWTIFLLKKL